MPVIEIGLVARAKGVSTHLLSRQTLERLADADDLGDFVRSLSRVGTPIERPGESADVFAVERAIGRTAGRHVRTLHRWQERTPGILDVFAASQDRRSLRALVRGAAEGAPSFARLEGLLPTRTLPERTLARLANQSTPADVVSELMALDHPYASRVLPLVQTSQADLLAIDIALLVAFAERATLAVGDADDTARDFVRTLIDVGNAQNALLLAGGPHDMDPADVFVRGGRWLPVNDFVAVAASGSQEKALTLLAAALAASPLASSLPVSARDLVHLDRALLTARLNQLARAARVEPLGSAPLLRVLLLLEAQSRDLRGLAWGAVLGTPSSLRKQQLVTPI